MWTPLADEVFALAKKLRGSEGSQFVEFDTPEDVVSRWSAACEEQGLDPDVAFAALATLYANDVLGEPMEAEEEDDDEWMG